MTMQIACRRSTARAGFAFISLVGLVTAVAAAKGMGFLEAAVARRAIGLLIGVMALVIGNFLPKLRPLNSPDGNLAKGMAAERFGGWILVLAGIAYIALFLFAPLDQAGLLSSAIGISALMVIAANWAWLGRGALSRSRLIARKTRGLSEQAEERKLVIWLLFAFAYVFATASAVSLLHNRPWVHDFGSWIVLGFGMMYAVLYGVLESKRGC
jgi:hypothetical protein